MGDVSDRDRQPSARYIERLAERITDMIMMELSDSGLVLPDSTPRMQRQYVYWTVITASKELKAENEARD